MSRNKGRKHFRSLLAILWEHKKDFILALVFTGALSGLIMLLPRWARRLIHEVIPAGHLGDLGLHLAWGLLLILVLQIFLFAQDFLRMRLSHTISADLRVRMFRKIVNMPFRQAEEWRSGDLISRLSSDILVFQNGLMRGLFKLVPNLIVLVCLLALMFFYSIQLTLLTLLVLFPLAGAVYFFIGRIRSESQRAQERSASLNDLIGEAVRGLGDIKAFLQERRIEREFALCNEELLDAQVKRDRMAAMHPAVVLLVTAAVCSFLVFACVWMIRAGRLSLENLTAFLICLGISLSPIQEISRSVGFISKIFAVMDRFEDIFQLDVEMEPSSDLPDMQDVRGRIQFLHVCFSYGREFSLKDISLDISPGQTIALVGPSGAGKTTLINLLLRFLEPDAGEILIDNRNIRFYSVKSLRQNIAYVPQEPILFYGSLKDNLSFVNPKADFEEIIQASKAAHVHEFAETFPEGYETHIGRYGGLLSVGQRQRIAIARAFLKDAQILILDEPTSALDAQSEALIRDSLSHLFFEKTMLIIAHRISTIRNADRIIVLDGGAVIETGSHDDLMQNEGVYKRLFEEQMLRAQ